MKTYSIFLQELNDMQRMKRSIASKKKSKIAATKRKISMRKPPSPEKIQKALDRQLRQKALGIVDKQGVYKDAAAGTKANLEKKASKLLSKKKGTWTKQLRPEVKKKMTDAFKNRTSSKHPESE